MKPIDFRVSRFVSEHDVLTVVSSSSLPKGGVISLCIDSNSLCRSFAVSLDRSEVASMRDTLLALEPFGSRSVVRLYSDGLDLELCHKAMGEPYREGALLSLRDGLDSGASIFLEERQRTDLRLLFDRLLA